MARLQRIKQFAIKQESSSGTAETLTASDVPLICEELSSSYEREMNERNPLRAHLSRQKPIPGLGMGTLVGKVELVAGGDETTPPACDLILKACGLQRHTVYSATLTTGTGTPTPGEMFDDGGTKEGRVISFSGTTLHYALISGSNFADTDSLDFATSGAAKDVSGTPAAKGFAYRPNSETSANTPPTFTSLVNDDGVATEIYGAMGTATLSAAGTGKLGYLNFELRGAAEQPDDVTLFTGTTPLEVAPQTFLSAALNVGGDALCVDKFSLDLGNSVNPTKCANSATGIQQYRITERAPKIEIDPEAQLESAVAYFQKYADAESFYFYAQIGQSAGKRCAVVAPVATYDGLSYAERDGILAYSASLALNGDQPDGDDEFLIVFY